MGLVAKAFQDIITFSRSTQTGTYVNSNGYITNSSVLNYLTYSNQPENAAWTKSNSFVQQNLLLYSEDFTNPNWPTTNVAAPTANTTIAPDGTLTADTLTCSAGLNTHNIQQNTTLTGTPVTFSVYLKAGTHSFIQIFHGSLLTTYANFNLSTGVLGTVGASFTASITAVANGFYRCTVTFTPTAFSAFRIAFISSATAVYNESWTAAGTETVYLWGAQLVQGSVPGDYRATTSAALPCLYADCNGALRARKICEDAVASTVHFLNRTAATPGIPQTLYVVAKPAERSQLAIQLGTVVAYYNLATGTVISGTGASIESADNGYFRCILSGTPSNSNSQIYIVNGGVATYTGDGSSGIYIADAQLNDGSSALAYYDTSASAYNAPRFDYDPVTLAAKGLLIEEQRANLLLQSNDFQTSWSVTNITRTLNSTLSPSGNVDGVKIAATATAATALYQQANVAATSATFSVYVKQGTGATTANSFVIRNITTLTNLIAGTLDYSTGVFTYFVGSTGVVVSNARNGWWRVQISATTGITSGDLIAGYVGFSGGAATIGDHLYAYGAQLEAGAFATSYIPTVASQVTRGADVASVNTLSPWFNSVGGTLYFEGVTTAPVDTTVRNAVSITDGTTANMHRIFSYAGQIGGSTANGVSTVADLRPLTYTSAATFKFAYAYAANNFAAVGNGGAPSTDTLGTLPTGLSVMNIGNPANYWGFWVRRITYYPRRLTNAELQTLTTL
jgi:hypothetical protein